MPPHIMPMKKSCPSSTPPPRYLSIFLQSKSDVPVTETEYGGRTNHSLSLWPQSKSESTATFLNLNYTLANQIIDF